ncbi:MAG: peptidoglycan-binding domain-containing protein [Pseudomonadota bacterium]
MKYTLIPTLAALAACTALPDVASMNEPGVIQLVATAPPGAEAGSCWGQKTSPAVIETVERDILLQPAQISSDGRIQQPAVYKKERRQEIVIPRQETWFQVPCAADMTPEFVSSVQRALAARGLYAGPVTGNMDTRTRAAVRKFQAPEGLDSGILSTAAARRLGLIAVKQDPA